MFSVDNFYDFFSSHYGYEKSNAMIWSLQPHGSKSFYNLFPYYNKEKFMDKLFHWNTKNVMILHDQEPFKTNMLDTYKNSCYQEKKTKMWQEMPRKDLLHTRALSCSWPIFCHSERNSDDIDYLVHNGFIECHYFWHALTSRDWFRHWKHHADLKIKDQWKKKFLLYARDTTGTREYRKELVNKLTPMADQVEYNWSNTNFVSSDFSAKIVPEDAVISAIHIVSETVFDDRKIHLTEKIFKPIVMCQPFVLFAGPGSLEYLRSYGFKTFDSVWDESYDYETNSKARFDQIIKLITDLYRQDDVEFKQTLQKCNDIVNFNRRYFFSQNFENRVLGELHKNVRYSLRVQKEKNLRDPGGSFFHLMNSLMSKNIQLDRDLNEHLLETIKIIRQTNYQKYLQICQKYSWLSQIN